MRQPFTMRLGPFYEGFNYIAHDLKSFLYTAGIFTMTLKHTDQIIHHEPKDVEDFKQWLLDHGVADIRKEKFFGR